MEKIKEWLKNIGSGHGDGHSSGFGLGSGDGDGSGYGCGYGYSNGCGDGSGDGSEYGDGYGSGDGSSSGYSDSSGYGDGDGSGSGSSSGSGCGDGSSSGSGSGDGYGFGYGDGSGYIILKHNKKDVHMIDGIPTVIEKIKGDIAMGYMINDDFSTTPCYVAKGNGYFAHGETLRNAVEALRSKIFRNMNTKEVITEFVKKFKPDERYLGTEFFEWHHHLTGSCLMGRESFVRNRELNLENEYTVQEFIRLTENEYGGEVIRKLKEYYMTDTHPV